MTRMNPWIWILIGAVSTLEIVRSEGEGEGEAEAGIKEAGPVHPYQSIVDRNPFGLKPPAPPPPPPTNPPPPKADIFLTGYTSLLTPKHAYFETKDPQGKIQFYELAEGTGKDGIDLLQVDEKEKTVKIKRDGVEQLLTLALNGKKAPTGPPPPVAGAPNPGAAGVVPPPVPNPSQPNPGVVNTPANYNPNLRSLPSRPIRAQAELPSGYNSGGGGSFGGTGVNYIQPGNFGQPGNAASDLRGGSPGPNTDAPPPQSTRLSPEEQLIMMELQRAANPNTILPPPLPIPGSQPPGGQLPPQLPPQLPTLPTQ